MRSVWMGACVIGSLLVISGCEYRDIGPIEPRVSRAIDVEVGGDGIADVDLLFVIDDSRSMEEEQASLAAEIPRLVRDLTNPPLDAAGEPRWNPVHSLDVAVVTSDMGTAGVTVDPLVGGCGASGRTGEAAGFDGRLRTDEAGLAIQRWRDGDDADVFAARVGEVAEAGITGCGFEQPLAAAAAALMRREGGFPRDDAMLAVIVLTDEEDCSVGDAAAFFGATDDLNLRCVQSLDLLRPVEELVTALRGDREDDRFLYAAITGIPMDLEGSSPEVILADPRMAHMPDPDGPGGLRATCQATGPGGEDRGLATPGRRMVELARQVPGSLVASICSPDYQEAIAELTRRIGARIKGVCVNRALTPSSEGRVECIVRETLPAGELCSSLPARSLFEVDERGREVCDVGQAPAGAGTGWFYDASDPECDRVAFTGDAVAPFGTSVRLQCLVVVEEPSAGDPTGP